MTINKSEKTLLLNSLMTSVHWKVIHAKANLWQQAARLLNYDPLQDTVKRLNFLDH